MSVGCILLILLMVVVIAFNMITINKKRKIKNINQNDAAMDYLEAVQLPTIGSRTVRATLVNN